jgi:hypothetical protein
MFVIYKPTGLHWLYFNCCLKFVHINLMLNIPVGVCMQDTIFQSLREESNHDRHKCWSWLVSSPRNWKIEPCVHIKYYYSSYYYYYCHWSRLLHSFKIFCMSALILFFINCSLVHNIKISARIKVFWFMTRSEYFVHNKYYILSIYSLRLNYVPYQWKLLCTILCSVIYG